MHAILLVSVLERISLIFNVTWCSSILKHDTGMMWNWCANNGNVIICYCLNWCFSGCWIEKLSQKDTIKLNMFLSPQKSPRKRSTGPFDQVTAKENFVNAWIGNNSRQNIWNRILFSRALTTPTKVRLPRCAVKNPLTTQGVGHLM